MSQVSFPICLIHPSLSGTICNNQLRFINTVLNATMRCFEQPRSILWRIMLKHANEVNATNTVMWSSRSSYFKLFKKMICLINYQTRIVRNKVPLGIWDEEGHHPSVHPHWVHRLPVSCTGADCLLSRRGEKYFFAKKNKILATLSSAGFSCSVWQSSSFSFLFFYNTWNLWVLYISN